MDLIHLCLGCMAEKSDALICPHCGWRNGETQDAPLFLPPGTVLNGRYLIGRVLGFGGFGITYLAWDRILHVRLAVKEYLPQRLATRTMGNTAVTVFSGDAQGQFAYGLEKFIDEARMLAQFNSHPCIVSVSDFFKANNTAYLVMEYIEGITFQSYLDQKGGRISYETALAVMMPVMDALREVHKAGLLHRDISPDNIYITKDKRVKLLDFGAARYAVGEKSESLSVILKPGFAPEEQYRTKGVQGPWTDVYALSATIYRAVTGRIPPQALDRLNRDELQPPSQAGAKIRSGEEKSLLRALSVHAKDRYRTVREFQTALIHAKTSPELNSESVTRFSKRRLIAAIVLFLMAGFVGFAVWVLNGPGLHSPHIGSGFPQERRDAEGDSGTRPFQPVPNGGNDPGSNLNKADTPSGSILREGETWRQGGLELSLNQKSFDVYEPKGLSLWFAVANRSGKDVLLRYGSGNFRAVDNLNRPWPVGILTGLTDAEFSPMPTIGKVVPASGRGGEGVSLIDEYLDGGSRYGCVFVKFPIDDGGIHEIVVTISIGSIKEARWRVPLGE